jgi:Domain of unknown function DUF11
MRRFLVPVSILLLQLPAVTASATHAPFAPGDVLVGVGRNAVQWRHADGALDATHPTIRTAVASPSTTGMAFDLRDNLYVTGYTSNAISRFDPFGRPTGTFGDGYNSHPESISFDTYGHAYVGQEGGSRDILEFDATGGFVAAHDAQGQPKGTDRLDVGADQCTIHYTSQGKAVRRFDACAGQQRSALTTTLPGAEAFDLRILTSSDPTIDGDVLVADTQSIVRVDGGTGSIVSQFDAPSQSCWTALALGTSATRFWAGDRCSSSLFEFDLSSPTPMRGPIFTGSRTSIQGLAVNGGLTAATAADVAVAIADEPDPVSPTSAGDPTFVHYAIDVRNDGHGIARNVTLQASLVGGTVDTVSGTGWDCGAGTTAAISCTIPELNFDTSAATVHLVVQTGAGATSVAVSGGVEADEPDPDPTNNLIDPDDPPVAASNGARTAVEAARPDHVVSFCPAGGCSLDTDPLNSGPTMEDNTITRFQGNGPGGVFRADEFDPPGPVPIVCGRDDRSQLIVFDPPPGHTAANPAVLTVSMAGSSGVGGNPRPCTKDKLTGEDVPIPDCILPGRAEPAPCLESVSGGGGVVRTTTLWTSGDPPFRH